MTGLRELVAAVALAWTLAGEAPGCPAAQVAVAQVHENRSEAGIKGGWFGRRQPAAADLAVALTWRTWPDVAGDALYAIGPGDKGKMPWLRERVARFACAGGDFVEVWE